MKLISIWSDDNKSEFIINLEQIECIICDKENLSLRMISGTTLALENCFRKDFCLKIKDFVTGWKA